MFLLILTRGHLVNHMPSRLLPLDHSCCLPVWFKHRGDWDTGGNGCRYRWAPRMRGVFLAAAKRRLSGPCSGMSPPSLKIVKYTGIFHIVLDEPRVY